MYRFASTSFFSRCGGGGQGKKLFAWNIFAYYVKPFLFIYTKSCLCIRYFLFSVLSARGALLFCVCFGGFLDWSVNRTEIKGEFSPFDDSRVEVKVKTVCDRGGPANGTKTFQLMLCAKGRRESGIRLKGGTRCVNEYFVTLNSDRNCFREMNGSYNNHPLIGWLWKLNRWINYRFFIVRKLLIDKYYRNMLRKNLHSIFIFNIYCYFFALPLFQYSEVFCNTGSDAEKLENRIVR